MNPRSPTAAEPQSAPVDLARGTPATNHLTNDSVKFFRSLEMENDLKRDAKSIILIRFDLRNVTLMILLYSLYPIPCRSDPSLGVLGRNGEFEERLLGFTASENPSHRSPLGRGEPRQLLDRFTASGPYSAVSSFASPNPIEPSFGAHAPDELRKNLRIHPVPVSYLLKPIKVR